jgi:hypothetical protein
MYSHTLNLYIVDAQINENNKYLLRLGLKPVLHPKVIETVKEVGKYAKSKNVSPTDYINSYFDEKYLGDKLLSENSDNFLKEYKKAIKETINNDLKDEIAEINYKDNNVEPYSDYLNYFFDLSLEKNNKLLYKLISKNSAKKALAIILPLIIINSYPVKAKPNLSELPHVEQEANFNYIKIYCKGPNIFVRRSNTYVKEVVYPEPILLGEDGWYKSDKFGGGYNKKIKERCDVYVTTMGFYPTLYGTLANTKYRTMEGKVEGSFYDVDVYKKYIDLFKKDFESSMTEETEEYIDLFKKDFESSMTEEIENLIPSPLEILLQEVSPDIYDVYEEVSDVKGEIKHTMKYHRMIKDLIEKPLSILENIKKANKTEEKIAAVIDYEKAKVAEDGEIFYSLKLRRINKGCEVCGDFEHTKNRVEAYHSERFYNSYSMKYNYYSLNPHPHPKSFEWYLVSSEGEVDEVFFDSVRDWYVKTYGFSLPDKLDFEKKYITHEKKEELMKIRDLAENTYIDLISGDITVLPPTYKEANKEIYSPEGIVSGLRYGHCLPPTEASYVYPGVKGKIVTDLRKVTFNFQQFTLGSDNRGDYVLVPRPMKPYIDKYSYEEVSNYINTSVEILKNYQEEPKKKEFYEIVDTSKLYEKLHKIPDRMVLGAISSGVLTGLSLILYNIIRKSKGK